MKYAVYVLAVAALSITACASKKKQDAEGLEKYPQCYHKNVKISTKCIKMNDAGEETTALKLENAAYPGQYK
jgi:hypothetical protein